MIAKSATFTIQVVDLRDLYVQEYQQRYLKVVKKYVRLLRKYPDCYAGFIHVKRSDRIRGMFVILDGHHKYVASIIAGRTNALCIIEEE